MVSSQTTRNPTVSLNEISITSPSSLISSTLTLGDVGLQGMTKGMYCCAITILCSWLSTSKLSGSDQDENQFLIVQLKLRLATYRRQKYKLTML